MAHKGYGIATLSTVPTNPQGALAWTLGHSKESDASGIPDLPMPPSVRLDPITPLLEPLYEVDPPRSITRGLVDHRART